MSARYEQMPVIITEDINRVRNQVTFTDDERDVILKFILQYVNAVDQRTRDQLIPIYDKITCCNL